MAVSLDELGSRPDDLRRVAVADSAVRVVRNRHCLPMRVLADKFDRGGRIRSSR